MSYEGKMLKDLSMPSKKEVEQVLLKILFKHNGVIKEFLPTKSFEVQKIVKKLIETPRPIVYNPFDTAGRIERVTRESLIRTRGFRQAVLEAYEYKCAFCGMKMQTPDSLCWEVEAAHIVPRSKKGKDDVLNGLSLCHLHHWAFDTGWFTLKDDLGIWVSSKVNSLPSDFGRMGDYDFIRVFFSKNLKINLPKSKEVYPHQNAINWHRENIFHP